MDWLWDVRWREMLLPGTPLLEIVVRGTMVYLGALLIQKEEGEAHGSSRRRRAF